MQIETVSRLDDRHLTQLRELLEAAARADGHEPIGERKSLRLRRGGDPDAAVLAFDTGRLVGYAHVVTYHEGAQRRASCEIVVHPDQRRRGVGRRLFERVMSVARQQQVRRVDLWAYNHAAATAEIAAAFELLPTRRLLHLHRHMAGPVRTPTPPGVRLRSFQPVDDDEALLALNNRIFAGHPENGAWTLDDLRARMEQPFDPDDVLMLEADGALAGFCWMKVRDLEAEGRAGEIYVIGTAPEAQGRGLGRYLLTEGLARLHRRAADVAAIYVDESNQVAVALYESMAFHHHHVDVCYSRDLSLDGAVGPPAEVAA